MMFQHHMLTVYLRSIFLPESTYLEVIALLISLIKLFVETIP